MAQRRMFSKDVTNSDVFLDLPLSTQALYFHLGMNADDDWFVQPKAIMRLTQAKDDDLKLLMMKWFCISFVDSVIVITHWKQNNQLRNDRYKPTVYQNHMKVLWLATNKEYKMKNIIGIPNGNQMETQYSIVENSIVENNSSEWKIPPSLAQVSEYCKERENWIDPEEFISFYASKGWMVGKNKMKDWKASIITRERKRKKEQAIKEPTNIHERADLKDKLWIKEFTARYWEARASEIMLYFC